MNMTREEAVELLCYGDWLNVISEHIGKTDTDRIAEAMSIVGQAIRPVSREQVEKTQPTLTPPNEPLTLEDAKKERYIWFTPLNDWAKVTPFGVLFFGSEELMNWETLCEEWGYRFKAYRRPPEGEA